MGENSGDCCDNNVCKNLMGGTGKVCGPPPPPPCEPQGQSCENINLPACERGQWNTESSEFIMCLKPSCKPQGQSCENSGDCWAARARFALLLHPHLVWLLV